MHVKIYCICIASLLLVLQVQGQRSVALLTKFEVKEGYQQQFKAALKSYVAGAVASPHNIMAEGYTEENQPLVFWVIERWDNKGNAEKVSISNVGKKALSKAAQKIYLNDLEPVSKKQWRATAGAADRPLPIMLFVDAKPGTAHRFKEIYHEAMPRFRSEPGVINYQLSQFTDDSTRFVTYERFRNEAAFQYHLNFPPIQPVIDYLHTSIRQQPFERGLHRLIELTSATQQ